MFAKNCAKEGTEPTILAYRAMVFIWRSNISIRIDLQVATRWLPLIREVHGEDHEKPVILVGNKSDGPNSQTEKVARPTI